MEFQDKQMTVDDFLAQVSYEPDPYYVPSDFALEFVNFMKLVDGGESENITPVIHYKIIDKFIEPNELDTINLCHRGAAKTTLKEYLILYLATFNVLPGFGKVPYGLYVSDSIDNGVKKMRKSLEYRWNNSEFLQQYIPTIKFTDIRWEFINKSGISTVISGHGAKALALDSVLYTEHAQTTIGECQVGDRIYGADGKLCTITKKSEIFHKPMYQLALKDGRSIKVSEDHINSILVRGKHSHCKERMDVTTKELLKMPLVHTRQRTNRVTKEDLIFVENCAPVQFPKANLPIDPYTLGVILGDGRVRKDCGSVELTGHIDDFPHYLKNIPYVFGEYQIDTRNSNVRTQSIRGLGRDLVAMKLNVHGNMKFIPELYMRGSIEQRLALLQGLMDTDGTISARKLNPVTSFCSNSEKLVDQVSELVYSLGGHCFKGRTGQTAFRLQIHLNMPVFKLPRKAVKQKIGSKKEYVAVKSITQIDLEPSQCIAVDNEERQFITEMFFRTHNTGVRGTRENGSRPVLALLDDLISDEDARSPTVIASVEDTVYKAIDYALHPQRRKIIWSGTPFNAKDPLYKAVNSGAWNVNVFPVCEKFPCLPEEFRGSWPDRFDYHYVKKQYDKAIKAGKLDSFNQELMLKIMSEEDRLIKDSDIGWYQRSSLLQNKGSFNFYITTDLAVSDKESADFSVILVWALNSNGDWLLVDGVCKRMLLDESINHIFRFAQMYRPLETGIEVTGQQKGFIRWIKNEMMTRNNYFTLANDKNTGEEGIRPNTSKFVRFNSVVPLFKAKKILFPEEMKQDSMIVEILEELSLVSVGGFKSKHDDCLDNISMLPLLNSFKPSADQNMVYKEDSGIWEMDDIEPENSDLDSYIV